MIILDTNVLSEPLRKDPNAKVVAWLDAQAEASLFLTAITMAELLAGMEILPAGKRKDGLADALRHMLGVVFSGRILPFEEEAARCFGTITKHTRKIGSGIGMADAQIASIALANDYSIATRDTSPFVASGVRVIDPWSS